jgi:hypothetical protein
LLPIMTAAGLPAQQWDVPARAAGWVSGRTEGKLKITGESRGRYERRTGQAFGRDPDLDTALIRNRLSVSVKPVWWLRFSGAVQDSRAPGYGLNAPSVVADANRRMEELIASMRDIGDSSEKISRIIKVIDEIAFQTNILALNAAVEAARAGEAGMGFAVVADEVRSLAQRSAQAARDTTALIQESIARSAEGNDRVVRVTEAMNLVTAGASNVRTLLEEVTTGSRQQAEGTEQISKAVHEMQKSSQSVAASAEQGAAAGEELSSQCQLMRGVAGRLMALVDGAR